MDSEAFATMIGLDAQHEGYVKQAMELISMILEQIQKELGKQSIRCPTENVDVPDEKGKNDARERYQQLHSDYKIMSDQLDAFAREKAKAPWRRGQDQGKLQVAQARARIQDLEAEVKVLQARCDDSQAQASQPAQDLQMLSIEIKDLRQKNKALQSEIDSIEQQYKYANQSVQNPQRLHIEIKNLKEINDGLRSQVDSLEEQYEKARQRTALFRSMIFRPSECRSNQLDVTTYYEKITNKIFDLFPKYLNFAPKRRPKEQHQRRQRDVSLSKIWDENLNDDEKGFRCMAAIFEFLNDEILLKPAFGLEDDDETGTLESGLVEFEKRLQACPKDSINYTLRNKWINLTLENVKMIRKKGPGTKPYSLASDLENFLRPVSKSMDENLRREILELCKLAFDLNLSLRSEHNCEYRIYYLEPGTIPEELPKIKLPGSNVDLNPQPNILEYMGIERGYPEPLVGGVAFTMFGGLSCFTIDRDYYETIVVPAKVCFRVK